MTNLQVPTPEVSDEHQKLIDEIVIEWNRLCQRTKNSRQNSGQKPCGAPLEDDDVMDCREED